MGNLGIKYVLGREEAKILGASPSPPFQDNYWNSPYVKAVTKLVLQGTILDRIDYNIEQTATRVDQGLKQLQKAEKYQKKNRKMMIIVILFVIVIVLIVVLIAKKS